MSAQSQETTPSHPVADVSVRNGVDIPSESRAGSASGVAETEHVTLSTDGAAADATTAAGASTDESAIGGPEAEEPDITPLAKHDEEPHAEFRRFMATGWAPVTDTRPPRDECAPYTAKRRALLGARFPTEALVVPSGGLQVRANDTDYPFRPGSDFFWLTGCHEPDAVLVLHPTAAGDHEAVLYLADRSDRSTAAFYTDRRYGELWVGPRPGVRETAAALDIECRPLGELPEALARLAPGRTRVLRGVDNRVDRAVSRWSPADGSGRPLDRDQQLAETLSELRLLKDDFEIARLDEAVAATVTGFAECVAEFGRAMTLPAGER